MKKPFLLCILDGCGIAPKGEYNAFDNAYKPTFDKIMEDETYSIEELYDVKISVQPLFDLKSKRVTFSQGIPKSICCKEFFQD